MSQPERREGTAGFRMGALAAVAVLFAAHFALYALMAQRLPFVVLGAAMDAPAARLLGALGGRLAWPDLWRLVTAQTLHIGFDQLLVSLAIAWMARDAERLAGRWLVALVLLCGGVVGELVLAGWYAMNLPVTAGAGAGLMAVHCLRTTGKLKCRAAEGRDAAMSMLMAFVLLYLVSPLQLPAHLAGGVLGGLAGVRFAKQSAD